MKKTVITISRQYGSGGRLSGQELSKLLNIPYYDRAIVDLAAKESGMNADFIENGEQKITASMLFNIATTGYGGYFSEASTLLSDNIFFAESKVIMDVAENAPCVIVGRCADYILKDNFDCFNVFIYADPSVRAERVATEKGLSLKEAEKLIRASDKKRSRHYEHYTGQSWGRANNYHLLIDGGKISPSTIAEIIARASGLK